MQSTGHNYGVKVPIKTALYSYYEKGWLRECNYLPGRSHFSVSLASGRSLDCRPYPGCPNLQIRLRIRAFLPVPRSTAGGGRHPSEIVIARRSAKHRDVVGKSPGCIDPPGLPLRFPYEMTTDSSASPEPDHQSLLLWFLLWHVPVQVPVPGVPGV